MTRKALKNNVVGLAERVGFVLYPIFVTSSRFSNLLFFNGVPETI
jgi:hypothetical protein